MIGKNSIAFECRETNKLQLSAASLMAVNISIIQSWCRNFEIEYRYAGIQKTDGHTEHVKYMTGSAVVIINPKLVIQVGINISRRS